MRFMRKFFLTLVFVGILAANTSAEDPCNSSVIRTWEAQRDASAVKVLKLFLANAGPEAIREEGFELLRNEILLSPCVPPLRMQDFYLLGLHEPDPDLLPVAVLKGYLRKHRVPIEARDFFYGKTFWLESK